MPHHAAPWFSVAAQVVTTAEQHVGLPQGGRETQPQSEFGGVQLFRGDAVLRDQRRAPVGGEVGEEAPRRGAVIAFPGAAA